MDYKLCICGCGRFFPATRRDRNYFEKSCRNSISNQKRNTHKETKVDMMPFARQQDFIIQNMIPKEAAFALIDERYLSDYKIDINRSMDVIRNADGIIMAIRFVETELIRMYNEIFKMQKVSI